MPTTTLPQLDPKSQAMLAVAGITTVQQLQQLGAATDFVAARRAGGCPSLNLLWAIEAALSGRNWQTVARTDRLTLLNQVELLETFQS